MKRGTLALLSLLVLACVKKPFTPPQAKNARPLRGVTYERTPLLAADPGDGGSEVFTEDGQRFFTVRSPALIEQVRDASGRVTDLVDHGFFGFRATRVK